MIDYRDMIAFLCATSAKNETSLLSGDIISLTGGAWGVLYLVEILDRP
jgi:hypothetical protein